MPHSTTTTWLALALCLSTPLTTAAIYRCSDAEGQPLFSQFPCAGADAVETVVLSSISVIPAAPLTRSEHATLAEIQRQFRRQQSDTASAQQRARRRSSEARAEQMAICADTRESLRSLRERKRGGYSLSRATALDAEEAQLKARVSEHC